MKRYLSSIGFIALVVIFLPTVVFSVYEFSSLKKNEEVINEIYKNQLDALMFSINQYAEDIIAGIAGQLVDYDLAGTISRAELSEIQDISPFVTAIAIIPFNAAGQPEITVYSNTENRDSITISTLQIIGNNQELIERLSEFAIAGYRKIEAFETTSGKNQTLLMFAANKNGSKLLYGIIIDNKAFVQLVLSSRIQYVAQEKFILEVIDHNNNSVYKSDPLTDTPENSYQQSIWLLPGYALRINLAGTTIESIIKQRSRQNLIFLALLDIALLFGAWLIFRNIRKESRLNQLKSNFISNVSHEVRTPLALIKMYIETLEMGRVKSEDKRSEYYSIISHESSRLASIVNKILSFSKIENEKQHYQFKNVPLNQIVEDVVLAYSHHLKVKGFTLKKNLDEAIPEIYADSEALSEVLVNLLDNAIKYSDREKKIILSTGRDSTSVFLVIEDKGLGISEQNQKHIFEKFFRVAEGDLAYKTKGSGLGLAIVKHIIDVHQGQIFVSSTLGKGTKFTLHFPLKNRSKN
jgi:two-component system phosphate regulon sensor histidine kinase PhoR